MVFYEWVDYGGDCEGHVFSSLEEAHRSLRKYLLQGFEGEFAHGTPIKSITVCRIDIGKLDRAKVLAILNREGYVDTREDVETLESIPCGKCEFCDREDTQDCKAKRIKRKAGK